MHGGVAIDCLFIFFVYRDARFLFGGTVLNLDGYLLCIIGTVLLSSLLTALLPEGKTSASVKAVAKLICLLAIISPIPRFLQIEFFFDGIDDTNNKNSETNFSQTVIETDESFIKYYCKIRVENAQKGLQEEILAKFSIGALVTLDWEYQPSNDDIKIEKIYVKTESELDGEAKKQMWEYLRKNYCSEVLIE